MNTILVYPIGELSEKRLSRLMELELSERGVEVTLDPNENVHQAVFVVGTLDDEVMEIIQNTAVNAEKVVCCRYIECETDGIFPVERPFDVGKLCDELSRSQKREKAPDGLTINGNDVAFGGEKIDLSKKELELLKLLKDREGEVVLREEAQRIVFGSDSDSNAVDVYIRYLRKKLDLAFDQRMIITVRNKGYMLKK